MSLLRPVDHFVWTAEAETEVERQREIERQRDRHSERDRDRETETKQREIERQRDRHKERDRDRETETDTETEHTASYGATVGRYAILPLKREVECSHTCATFVTNLCDTNSLITIAS